MKCKWVTTVLAIRRFGNGTAGPISEAMAQSISGSEGLQQPALANMSVGAAVLGLWVAAIQSCLLLGAR